MESQSPLFNQPSGVPGKPEFIRYGMHPLDEFIAHDKYRNTIHIKNTKLLAVFTETRQYMEELHKRVMNEVAEKYRWNMKLARTTHAQLSAVVRRYLPVIEAKFHEWYPPLDTHLEDGQPPELLDLYYQPLTAHQHEGLMERERLRVWQEAIEQAELVEQRAKEIVDKSNEERQAGNIEFVQKLDRGGKQFTKRAG